MRHKQLKDKYILILTECKITQQAINYRYMQRYGYTLKSNHVKKDKIHKYIVYI